MLSNVTSPLLLKLPMMNDFSGLLDQDGGDHSSGNQLTPPRKKRKVLRRRSYAEKKVRREKRMKKRVMCVFGTRPEAIKICPLVLEMKKREGLEVIVCVTAQHRQMLDQVLETFGVKPDYDLNIMKDRQTLFDITTNILMNIKTVLEEVKPDVVLVHGDTSLVKG